MIGGTLVFTGSLTAYITPAILGGSKVLMLETLLYQRVSLANDYVSASVIAFILIVMSFHHQPAAQAAGDGEEQAMTSRLLGPIVLFLVLAFLIGPFLIIIAASLSAGETLAFPPQGLSLRWVIKVFQVESFQASFAVSMFLAIGGTLAALLLGVPAAYALSRYGCLSPRRFAWSVSVADRRARHHRRPGDAALSSSFPFRFGILPALFFAHTALILPYAVRVVSASLNNLRADIEEAAVLLGSTACSATFFRVVMPNIRGGILAAFILGFVTSFNQVPVSLFLSGPGIRTLPIDMLAYMEIVFDPSIAALASLLAFMSIGIVFLAERFLGCRAMSDDRYLILENLTLAYGETVAVKDLDLAVGKGELVALLGPSGCGKTTTMRAIAGLLKPARARSGSTGGTSPASPPTGARSGWCSSPMRCFPHLNVFENVAFGLKLKGLGAR